MSNRNVGIAVAIAVIAIAAVVGVRYFGNQGGEAKAVSIAFNIPLTGPIAAWSGQYPNGFKMGLEDGCKDYGVDCDRFEVDYQDNAGKPAQAVNIVNKQKLKGFDVYISGTSRITKAVAPIVDATTAPHFVAAFLPFTTTKGKHRHRVLANSKIEAPIFIDYAIKSGAKKVYILQLNAAYAEQQMGQMVEPALKKKGIHVIRELYGFKERDFKTLAAKVKSENPDLIFVVGYSFHLQPLLRDLRSSGLVQRGRVVAVLDFIDLVYNKTPLGELKDILFMAPFFDIKGEIAAAPAWRARYKKRFGVNPSYVPAYAYDTARIIVKAYADAGKMSSTTIRGALPFKGITGLIDLDKDRDLISTVALSELTADRKVVRVKY